MLQWLYSMLQVSVPNVLSVCQMYVVSVFICCCIYFTYILEVFSACCVRFCNSFKCFYVFFQVFHMHASCISSDFRRMLQVYYLNISKVDRVLHLPPHLLLPRLDVSSASGAASEVQHGRLGPSPSRCSSWA